MTQKVDAPLDSACRNRFAERVRRLQFRIAKATREGKWRLVKNLQRLLTHSYAAKVLAVVRVMTNQGRNTPGVDRIVWKTPEDRQKAVESLTGGGYKPLPLRRVYIPKRNGSLRPLGIPTMKDRAMQALHLMALMPVAEVTADKDSYGFRPKRSAADAIEQCFSSLARRCSPRWILEFDIKGCFDSISHDWLMTHIPMDKGILQKWLKAGYIDRRRLFPSQAGTPQGGIISACLANMALDGLQEELKRHFRVKDKVNLIRYADDGVVTGVSKELLEQSVLPVVKDFMRGRGLELSQEKTRVVHITEGFDFLGQNVRKYGKNRQKLFITPARKNVQSVLRKTRDFLKKAQAFPQETVISVLNPILRGWGTIIAMSSQNIDLEGSTTPSGLCCGDGANAGIPISGTPGSRTVISRGSDPANGSSPPRQKEKELCHISCSVWRTSRYGAISRSERMPILLIHNGPNTLRSASNSNVPAKGESPFWNRFRKPRIPCSTR